MQYKRILLKLSGEALAGERGYGIDSSIIASVAEDITEINNAGVQVGIVIGGGNIFRGVAGEESGIDRTTGDTVGMLATMMNSFMVKDALVQKGTKAVVLSAVQADKIAELFTVDRAKAYFEEGYVVIVAGGTGNPFFTTDTAAALRCAEMECDVLFKATKVDGVYDSDPMKNPDAVKLTTLTHNEALQQGLRIMDTAAFALCQENSIPIFVFKLLEKGNLLKAVSGEPVGSTISKG